MRTAEQLTTQMLAVGLPVCVDEEEGESFLSPDEIDYQLQVARVLDENGTSIPSDDYFLSAEELRAKIEGTGAALDGLDADSTGDPLSLCEIFR